MRDRLTTANQLPDDGRKKPWRVAYWENEKRRMKHFSKKIDAELFARQYGWEVLDPALAVSAEERLLIGKVRGAAAVLGVEVKDIIEAGLDAMKSKSTNAPLLGDAIKIYIEDSDLSGARDPSLKNLKSFLGFFEKLQPNVPTS